MSQAALAEAVGVSREQWGKYERGAGVPGGDVLARAARQGIDVRYVLTGSRDYAPPPALSAEEQTLIDRWREASREVKNAAMGALLGAGLRHTQQEFKGPVGNVIRAPVVASDLSVHMTGGDYAVKPKRKKAPKP